MNADVLIHRVPLELKLTGSRGYLVPGKRDLLRKHPGVDRDGISPLPESGAGLVSEARWEKQVENFRSHRKQGRGFLPVAPKTPFRVIVLPVKKMRTSTFRSSGCRAPCLTVNGQRVLTKSLPGQQPPHEADGQLIWGASLSMPEQQGHRA